VGVSEIDGHHLIEVSILILPRMSEAWTGKGCLTTTTEKKDFIALFNSGYIIE
jgi:hypothetical protein